MGNNNTRCPWPISSPDVDYAGIQQNAEIPETEVMANIHDKEIYPAQKTSMVCIIHT